MAAETTACRLCGGPLDPGAEVAAAEMMFGSGERFRYSPCRRCGAQSLLEIPPDLARHYPPTYYSLEAASPPPAPLSAATRLRRLRLAAVLRLPVPLADRLGARGLIPHYARWFAGLEIRPTTPILDVGAGAGSLLTNMAIQGFTDLLGIDPYLERERRERPVRLLRANCEELTESFGIVMINHALEHVVDPVATLAAARGRLAAGGHMIVRTPAYDSRNARHYGTDWVHWDAPRHLQLPTGEGLRLVTGDAGLRVVREFRDGQALGFWGSEQYRLGIPLNDGRSWRVNPDASPFSREQIAGWERQARALNARREGDAVTLVLAPA